MRFTSRAALLVIGVLVTASTLAITTGTAGTAFAEAAEPTITHVTITGADGQAIAATVFRPVGASANDPVPIVLNSHGWGGSRVKTLSGTVGAVVSAGYGVLTFDARGHGDSEGVATVHHVDHETRDFTLILDWIHDHLGWVEKSTEDGQKDIVAGAFGYSYAGGFQTMTASHDGRLDAVVPEMTWSDLRYSLAPHGVAKSVWVDLLYWSAKAGGTDIHSDIDDWYREIMITNEVPQAALDHFAGSSPTYAEAGNVNVLIVQGIPDVLFNLNEGIANYLGFEGASTGDVRLSTHLTGHVIPFVQPLGVDPYRTDPSASRHPCGDLEEQTLAWFDEHLRGNTGAADAIPEVAYALENGECVRLDALDTATTRVDFPALPAPQAGGSVMVPLLEGPHVVAGIPHLSAAVTAPASATLNLGLVVVGPDGGAHVVDDQSTGVRVTGSTLDLDLAGIATRLGPQDTLFLRVDGVNEWYAHNGARTPGAAVLEDVVVTLPLVPDA